MAIVIGIVNAKGGVAKTLSTLNLGVELSRRDGPVLMVDFDPQSSLTQTLGLVAEEENIPLAEHTFTTNSKDALLLGEACKQLGSDAFYALHEKIFSAFFVDKKNIGDRNILREIAKSCGIDDDTIDSAWTEPKYQQRLLENFNHARKYQIKSVPSFVFGERVLTGVVDEAIMRESAAELINI